MTAEGYFGTPLHKKLEFKPGFRIWVIAPPPNYPALLAGADGVQFLNDQDTDLDVIHLFAHSIEDLHQVRGLLGAIKQGGRLWISWAKKSSKLHNHVTEDHLRKTVLPLGWVDTKVCALDADWSGLKFLKRKPK